jgi:hypothetical protein
MTVFGFYYSIEKHPLLVLQLQKPQYWYNYTEFEELELKIFT